MDNPTLEKLVSADNEAATQQDLAKWSTQPDVMVGYYDFPAESNYTGPRPYRAGFYPLMSDARITTWTGVRMGVITSAHVYKHNFGARMVSMRVRGTNGAIYSGRASWDSGNVITLRKVKA